MEFVSHPYTAREVYIFTGMPGRQAGFAFHINDKFNIDVNLFTAAASWTGKVPWKQDGTMKVQLNMEDNNIWCMNS